MRSIICSPKAITSPAKPGVMITKQQKMVYLFILFLVFGIGPRAFCMLGIHSTTELSTSSTANKTLQMNCLSAAKLKSKIFAI